MSDTRVTVSKKALIIFLVIMGLLAIFLVFKSGSAKEVYHNCTQAKADGHANIKKNDPLYDPSLDRDKDGLACEL